MSVSQVSEGDLCANMVFSAAYKELYAPSLALLQAQCQALCASARNIGINNFGNCALGGVSDIEVQGFNLIRYSRCSERCTGQTAFEGDCGCSISANDALVVRDDDLVEGCDASILVNKVFTDRGWSNKYGSETPARPCPSASPGR